MSNSDFQIFARLYAFLSEFSATDIATAARRRNLSGNIREALEALATESRGADRKGSPVPFGIHKAIAPTPRKPKDPRKEIESFLLDAKRFPDKATLAKFAVKIGDPEAASPKYSRDRVASHIARKAVADEGFHRKLSEFMQTAIGVDPQSRGWMDIILGN